jgi:hypothetical protein
MLDLVPSAKVCAQNRITLFLRVVRRFSELNLASCPPSFCTFSLNIGCTGAVKYPHCERSKAIQKQESLDCFVATLLAMTNLRPRLDQRRLDLRKNPRQPIRPLLLPGLIRDQILTDLDA